MQHGPCQNQGNGNIPPVALSQAHRSLALNLLHFFCLNLLLHYYFALI